MIRVLRVAVCLVVFILLCDLGRPVGVLILIKNVHFFNIFSRLGRFIQVFGQLKEWLILELHNMIKLAPILACPIVLILLCDLRRHGVPLKH